MLAYLLLSFGIIVGQFYQLPLYYASVLFIIAIFCKYIFRNNSIRRILQILNLICIIIAAYSYSSMRYIYRQSFQLTQAIPHLSTTAYLNSPAKLNNQRYQAIIKITTGKFAGENFLINYSESYPLQAGSNYALDLTLQPINSTQNPDGFDYQQYLLAKNIAATGMLNGYPQKLNSNYSFSSQLTKIRISMIDYLQKTLDDQKYAGFFIALVTGYQGLIPAEQWDIFRHTGINHIISISGLHITLATTVFIFLINLLLKYLPIMRTPRQIILAWSGVFFAIIYALLAGFSIPTQRALYMIIIAAYLLANRRYLPLMYQLLISLALVLILDPFSINSIGFWFSYLLVAAIFTTIALYQPNSSKFKQWLKLQIIITLCGIPLSLFYFSSVSISSPIANLWAIPIIGNLFTPAVFIATVLHIPFLIKLVGTLLTYSLLPIEYLAKIPLYWQIKPNLASILISYIGIILLALPLPIRGKNILALFLIANIVFTLRVHSQLLGSVRIHAFSNQKVGFALVASKNHNILFINHNQPENIAPAFINTVLPYLNSQQIKHFDYVISNFDESELYKEFTKQRIRVESTDKLNNVNLDNVEFSSYRHESQLAVLVQTKQSLNYIGNCLPITEVAKVNNLFILMPMKDCNWLLDGNYDNLIINNGYKQQRQMEFILNNLNLNAKNSYSLYNNSSRTILSN